MIPEHHHGALVDQLVQASEPVRRIWPIRVRFTLCVVFGSLSILLIAWTWPRPDLPSKLRDPAFSIGLVALAVASAVTTLLALRSAVPGRSPARTEVALAAVLFTVGVLALVPATSEQPTPAIGWLCSARTLLVAVGPWMALLVAIRRGAPVRVRSAAAYAAAAALLFATTILRIGCPDDRSLHWLGWHLATVLVATALSVPLAATWLRAWRHG